MIKLLVGIVLLLLLFRMFWKMRNSPETLTRDFKEMLEEEEERSKTLDAMEKVAEARESNEKRHDEIEDKLK